MDSNISLIIGNLISLIAVYFTAKSSLARDNWHIYMYQVYQCLLLALASFFFNSYTGIITLLVCAFRNYMTATERLNKRITLFCFLMVVVFGIAINNRGYIGYVAVAANAVYTIGVYFAKTELSIKCNMFVNMVLWMIYEFCIMDIPSFISEGIGLVFTVAAIRRICVDKEQ